MCDFNIKTISGNTTSISKKELSSVPLTPVNITNTVTANLPQLGNRVPTPPVENVEFTKECVDENHK